MLAGGAQREWAWEFAKLCVSRAVPRAEQRCFVAVSDDGGRGWRTVADVESFWTPPFVAGPAGETLYRDADPGRVANGGLYWMVANAVTDHLQDRKPLAARGFSGVRPSDERCILNLSYSLDAFNWFCAGTVAMSPDPLESFSYASLLIDGDDLLVLSRTSLGGKNQHDTNLITFHRVHGFRSLALDLRPRFSR